MTIEEFEGEALVPTKKAFLRRDLEFPSVVIAGFPAKDIEELVRTVTREETNGIAKVTKTMGRGLFYPLSFQLGGKRFGCLYLIGVGRQSNFCPERFKETAPFILTDNRNIGSKTKEGSYLDANASLALMNLGVKTRAPLAGFFLESLETSEGEKTTPQLIAEGKIVADDDKQNPYISAWGMETPFRLRDLRPYLMGDQPKLSGFLLSAARYTYGLEGPFAGFYESVTRSGLSGEEIKKIWLEVIVNSAKDLISKIREKQISHPYLTDHNVSLHVELCDNAETVMGAKSEEVTKTAKKMDALMQVFISLFRYGHYR